MAIELDQQETAQIVSSLRKYFREELDQDLGEMRTKLLLNYFQQEIAPFAYNQGVKDAEAFFRGKVEDLTATCFEEGLTYWTKKRK
jgi:uncharacterized protein (DUF2164 family)